MKHYITDVHGDFFYEFVEMGRGDSNHWYAKRLSQIEKEILKYSDRIICVSENLRKQLEQNTGMAVHDYRIISCGVDLQHYDVPKATPPVNLDGRIVVGYSGALQQWQCIEDIIKIAILLHQKDERVFLIMYTMSSLDEYRDLLNQLGEGNYYVCSLRTEQVPSHLKLLDAGFLVRDNFVLNKVASPTKTPEYLAAGAGLICTPYSGDYEIYTKGRNNCFLLGDDRFGNIDGLLEWLRKLKDTELDNSFLARFSFQEQFDRAKVFEF
jgi:glycosyltransferase involved in cell wall biosynthesis